MANYSIVELVSNLPTDKFEELSRETGELRLHIIVLVRSNLYALLTNNVTFNFQIKLK